MKKLKANYPITFLAFLSNLVFSLAVLSLNYWHYPHDGALDVLQIMAHWAILSTGSLAIVLVLSIHRLLFLATFPLYTLISSIGAYFVMQMDISISPALLHSVFNTNLSEAGGLASFTLVLYSGTITLLTIIAVLARWRMKTTRIDLIGLIVLTGIAAALFGFVKSKKSQSFMRRIPFSYYYSVRQHIYENNKQAARRMMLGPGATSNTDSLCVILFLGEALRADHLQMNGYTRSTMPLMERRGVISYPNVKSIYTITWLSLPHILTRADSTRREYASTESSFIDIFKHSGFTTAWVGNQTPDASFRIFMHECDTCIINKPQLSDFSNTKRLDSDLLPPLTSLITNRNNQLIIAHLSGNHWWYNAHFPDNMAVFKPIMTNKVFSYENREKMINSYDNVTLFTDQVLDKFLAQLEDQRAVVIFLSDHGESFGENDKWLHANDVETEKNPACFIWMSEKYKTSYPAIATNAEKNRLGQYETAFLFHSILHAAQITSPWLDYSKSVFANRNQP